MANLNAAGIQMAYGAIAQAWEDSSPLLVIAEGVGQGASRHTHYDMESPGHESSAGTAESASAHPYPATAHPHPASAPESPPRIGGNGLGKDESQHENETGDRLPRHRFPDHVAPLPRIPSRG